MNGYPSTAIFLILVAVLAVATPISINPVAAVSLVLAVSIAQIVEQRTHGPYG